MTSQDPTSGRKRLEETLLAIKPGETTTVEALVAESGLVRETVERVLNALAKTELFERKDDVFIRRGLFESRTFSDADGRAIIVAGVDASDYGTEKP